MRAEQLPTPCYLIDEALLRRNLEILAGLQQRTGCRILLAQKAFACHALYPLIGEYLAGTAASGLFEARLAAEAMPGRENHVFSPAYRDADLLQLAQICDHIIFNSHSQLARFGEAAASRGASIGLRLNPQFSTQEQPLYDPCAPCSRFGVTADKLDPGQLAGVAGFHIHTLCEQDAAPLIATVAALEQAFGPHLAGRSWLNLGGGHHISCPGYDLAALEACIKGLQERYGLTVYLEPGEAIALNAGFLLTSVLDTVTNGCEIAILDSSAACHMPDVLEMPYRPPLAEAGQAGEFSFSYRLAGPTCLAGDIIGDYSFKQPLKPGDRLVFEDMAIYTMVKNNTFNGLPLPAIALREQSGNCRILRQFSYEDFKGRLA